MATADPSGEPTKTQRRAPKGGRGVCGKKWLVGIRCGWALLTTMSDLRGGIDALLSCSGTADGITVILSFPLCQCLLIRSEAHASLGPRTQYQT